MRWNIPHQPRVDWQLWFAAFEGEAQNRWIEGLVYQLLRGSPDVLALLGSNPFPDHPPKFVRAMLYDYRFTDAATRAKTGEVWQRREDGVYLPQVSLEDFAPASPQEPVREPGAAPGPGQVVVPGR